MENFINKLKNFGYRVNANDPVAVQGYLLANGRVAQKIPALLLLGPAGTGKTFFAECYSKALGFSFLPYQCHYGTGKEELLYDLDVKGVVEKLSGSQEDLASYLRPGILPQAIQRANELAKDGKGLVFNRPNKWGPSIKVAIRQIAKKLPEYHLPIQNEFLPMTVESERGKLM